ncbi:DUF3307 domain-containing protein [Pseudoroseicyclus aestuarii]|uniref:Uncharacterized protein DUF3307 n=1 Tax=Pseudoroseicyclus aestuarii TaxID=1795041 RepID=A0A318T630_9RHOB|nr:DUF3307 domain-containing protein [Pseudoroseicyclus aestuarii]PYE85874.1 uncharacterized protein DUF3307 [Pseudoroseicyclus aestuarii]
MTETFAALLFAHVMADFVLQPDRMAQNKRHPLMLLAHGLVVLAVLLAVFGRLDIPLLYALALAHLALDAAKLLLPPGLRAFLGDQAAHLATLLITAVVAPALWSAAPWAGMALLPAAMAAAAGFVLATRAGGFAVGLLMAPWTDVALPPGLPGGGRLIGLLERALIFLLVLVAQPAGIGFLIAAKSVLRFETAKNEGPVGEYVIIGTLASFGWGIACAYATRGLMVALGAPLPAL